MEYADEPRLVFSPLSEPDYCRFYQLEMDGYADDLPFYSRFLRKDDDVLELGCGTGRLTRRLASSCRSITGIDISREMLRLAAETSLEGISYLQIDMRDFAIGRSFNTTIIPHNTINLLADKESIFSCLRCCRRHLAADGRLLMQLYIPDSSLTSRSGEKIFQFAIHEMEDGGRLIKETLKSYNRANHCLTLEERYRVRPAGERHNNRDLRHTLQLFTPPAPVWIDMLGECGFDNIQTWNNYDLSPSFEGDSSVLLLSATAA